MNPILKDGRSPAPSQHHRQFPKASNLIASVTTTLALAAALIGTGCAGTKDSHGHILVIDRKDVRSWDPTNAWQKTGSNPDTYLPNGLKKGTPIDEAHGKWFVDPQDHSRFYVPNVGSDPFQHDYLMEQAKVATNDMPKMVVFPLATLFGMLESLGNLGP